MLVNYEIFLFCLIKFLKRWVFVEINWIFLYWMYFNNEKYLWCKVVILCYKYVFVFEWYVCCKFFCKEDSVFVVCCVFFLCVILYRVFEYLFMLGFLVFLLMLLVYLFKYFFFSVVNLSEWCFVRIYFCDWLIWSIFVIIFRF